MCPTLLTTTDILNQCDAQNADNSIFGNCVIITCKTVQHFMIGHQQDLCSLLYTAPYCSVNFFYTSLHTNSSLNVSLDNTKLSSSLENRLYKNQMLVIKVIFKVLIAEESYSGCPLEKKPCIRTSFKTTMTNYVHYIPQ